MQRYHQKKRKIAYFILAVVYGPVALGTNTTEAIQQGQSNSFDIAQIGDLNSSIAEQNGQWNQLEITQIGYANGIRGVQIQQAIQMGDDNKAFLSQIGDDNNILLSQIGDANGATLYQVDNFNTASLSQVGDDNTATSYLKLEITIISLISFRIGDDNTASLSAQQGGLNLFAMIPFRMVMTTVILQHSKYGLGSSSYIRS